MATKKARPGDEFETAFRASVPRGIYVRRLRTPTAMGFVVPQLVALVEELCKILHRPVPEWVTRAARFRFTPKSGVDFLMTAHAPVDVFQIEGLRDHLGAPAVMRVQPVVHFALELKSVAGVSIGFDNVDAGQEKALREAAAAGHVAGLVIEFRTAGEVWFVPVSAWDAYRAAADRKSLPLDLARRIGIEILADPNRGTARPYWDVAQWIVRCGGLLPEKPPKVGKKKGAAAQPAPVTPIEPEVTAVPAPLSLFEGELYT